MAAHGSCRVTGLYSALTAGVGYRIK